MHDITGSVRLSVGQTWSLWCSVLGWKQFWKSGCLVARRWFRQRVWLDDALSTVPTVLFVAGSALQSDLVEATECFPPTVSFVLRQFVHRFSA